MLRRRKFQTPECSYNAVPDIAIRKITTKSLAPVTYPAGPIRKVIATTPASASFLRSPAQ